MQVGVEKAVAHGVAQKRAQERETQVPEVQSGRA
jgi:hypothetical protein